MINRLRSRTRGLDVASVATIDAVIKAYERPKVAIIDLREAAYHVLEVEGAHVKGLDGYDTSDFRFVKRLVPKDEVPPFRLQLLIEHSPLRLNGDNLKAGRFYLTVERTIPGYEDRQARAIMPTGLKEQYSTRFEERCTVLGEPMIGSVAELQREALRRAREELPDLLYKL